jgi:tRNA(Arg) A34 adenosine deaminase TadA
MPKHQGRDGLAAALAIRRSAAEKPAVPQVSVDREADIAQGCAMILSSLHDETLLRLSIRLAREHMLAGDGGPFGAVVARGGEVLGEGWNKVLSSLDPTAHAEIVAIRAAAARLRNFSLEGCTLYASCEPCPMCLMAAYWARVDRIVFAGTRGDAARAGFDDAFLYEEIRRPAEQRKLPMQQMLASEAAAVFQEWNAKPDRVQY